MCSNFWPCTDHLMDHGLNGHCLKGLCPVDRRPPTRYISRLWAAITIQEDTRNWKDKQTHPVDCRATSPTTQERDSLKSQGRGWPRGPTWRLGISAGNAKNAEGVQEGIRVRPLSSTFWLTGDLPWLISSETVWLSGNVSLCFPVLSWRRAYNVRMFERKMLLSLRELLFNSFLSRLGFLSRLVVAEKILLEKAVALDGRNEIGLRIEKPDMMTKWKWLSKCCLFLYAEEFLVLLREESGSENSLTACSGHIPLGRARASWLSGERWGISRDRSGRKESFLAGFQRQFLLGIFDELDLSFSLAMSLSQLDSFFNKIISLPFIHSIDVSPANPVLTLSNTVKTVRGMAIQFLPWLRRKRDPFKPSSLNKGNDSNPAGVSKRLGQWSHTSRKRDQSFLTSLQEGTH
ncbi:hypothetical protein VNO78_37472 [Psophocarpus tetragonolobus]|uniref:Uncharacterized protein n=1 Tax=Psophocarpus tetragonolobus TaxID=3891 RepID=A0AAN9NCL6_PSOTE